MMGPFSSDSTVVRSDHFWFVSTTGAYYYGDPPTKLPVGHILWRVHIRCLGRIQMWQRECENIGELERLVSRIGDITEPAGYLHPTAPEGVR